MILRLCLRQRSAFANLTRPILSAQTSIAQQQCQARNIHAVPKVNVHDEVFKEKGIDGLLTPEAYNIAWTEYEGHMVDRLNTMLAEDEKRDLDPKTLSLITARDPSQAHIFNHASMAHNNHFFFSGLSPTETSIPEDLQRHLTTSFGSLATFRKTFLTHAAATFGPAFVWLVQTHNPSPNHPSVSGAGRLGSEFGGAAGRERQLHFRIVTTYLAGSPYPGAHWRGQGSDMNTQNLNGRTAEEYQRQTVVQNGFGGPGAQGGLAREAEKFGGADIVPVMCVNTWEHVWMWDWGVQGKMPYLSKWWDRVDWSVVWGRCDVGGNQGRSGGGYRF